LSNKNLRLVDYLGIYQYRVVHNSDKK